MKKLTIFILAFIPRILFCQGMDEQINIFLTPIVSAIGSVIFFKPFLFLGFEMPLVVMWLIIGALFFTFYFNFINLRGIKHSIDLIRGKYDNPNDKGEVSHFQALVTALSGTVGLGNIAGVAVAIATGGAGATFWMIMAGFLGMSSKFVECTLAVKYRKINENGVVSGGPMYYLTEGLKKQNKTRLGKILAAIFSVLCIGGSFGGGNMFQANQSYAQLVNINPNLAGNGVWFGCIMALFVGVVIIGGIKKIATVTDKLVPFMVMLYVGTSLFIIGMNINHIGEAIFRILDGAFNINAAKGGVLGVLIIGFQRASFSNEAGVGSAAIAHSTAKTNEPISEGIVSLLEPFIDTIVICTMTALVLIFTGYDIHPNGMNGSQLTSAAFSSVVPWFKYILTIAIILFAFSTMISWSYYGMKAWTYLFGNTQKMENIYKILFLFFTIIGSSASLNAVIDFSDMMILGMGFPNILGLYFMSSEIKRDLKIYFDKIKSGEIKKYSKS